MQRRSSFLVALGFAIASFAWLPGASATAPSVSVPLPAEGDAWEEAFHEFFRYEDEEGTSFRQETFEEGVGAHGPAAVGTDGFGDAHSVYSIERSFDRRTVFEFRYGDNYYLDEYAATVDETAVVDLLTRDVVQVRAVQRAEDAVPTRWNLAPGLQLTLPLGYRYVAEGALAEWGFADRDVAVEGVQGHKLKLGDAWDYETLVRYGGGSSTLRLHFLVASLDDAVDPPRATVAVRTDPTAEPVRELVFEHGFPLPVAEELLRVVVDDGEHEHDEEHEHEHDHDHDHGVEPAHDRPASRYEFGFSMARTAVAAGATPLPFGECINPVHDHERNPHATFHPLGTRGPEDPDGVLPVSIGDLVDEAAAIEDPDMAGFQEWMAAHGDAWVYAASLSAYESDEPWGVWSEGFQARIALASEDGSGYVIGRQSHPFTFPPGGTTKWYAYEDDPHLTLSPAQRASIELVTVGELVGHEVPDGDARSRHVGFWLSAGASQDGEGNEEILAWATMGSSDAAYSALLPSDDPARGPLMSTSDWVSSYGDAVRGARLLQEEGHSKFYNLAPMPPEEWLPVP